MHIVKEQFYNKEVLNAGAAHETVAVALNCKQKTELRLLQINSIANQLRWHSTGLYYLRNKSIMLYE